MLTPEQLAHLTAEEREGWQRCEAATKGPWELAVVGDCAGKRVVVAISTAQGWSDKDVPNTDCTFIAHAREGYPEALRNLAAARQDIRNLRKFIHIVSGHNQWFERCESLWCCPERYQSPVEPVESTGELLSIEDTGRIIAEMRDAIADAPHYCTPSDDWRCAVYNGQQCNCWKSRVK